MLPTLAVATSFLSLPNRTYIGHRWVFGWIYLRFSDISTLVSYTASFRGSASPPTLGDVQGTNDFATGLICQMFEASLAGDALLVLAEFQSTADRSCWIFLS